MKNQTRKLTSRALLLMTTVGLMACGTFKTKVDTAKMQNVKKVAVVGFDMLQQQPVSKMDLLKIAAKVSMPTGPGVGTRNEQEHVAELYDLLVQKLATEKGFQVVSRAELIQNPAYAAILKKRSEGFQSRPMVPNRYDFFHAPKVLDTFDVAVLTPEEKKSLQEALKVDAIIVVKSKVELGMSGFWSSLIGQATMNPYSTSIVSMVDTRTGEEIWNEPGAHGEPVANNEKVFLGMKETSKFNAMAKQAVASSLDTAFQRVKANAL